MHSPLVGPTTTRALADSLTDRGWRADAPDLRDSLESPQTFAAAASRSGRAVDVLVGHSGAGAVLPVIAHNVGATVIVFVDAVVPEPMTTFTTSGGFLGLLDRLPVIDGLLPPWNEWWPPQVLAQLVPDVRLRASLFDEIPRLSRAFYDKPVTLPDLWWQRPSAFLQLSTAYDEELARAGQQGWPTHRRNGQHLDLLTQPGDIADAVIRLTHAAQRPPN